MNRVFYWAITFLFILTQAYAKPNGPEKDAAAAARRGREEKKGADRALSWKTEKETVALMNGDKIIWKHIHRKKEGKPYIHPLSTVDGEVLTWLRPADHVWHRALWFSWKYINGLNYWEENKKTGLSQGLTEIMDVKVETKKDFSAQIDLTLSYHPPEEEEIMAEKRTLIISAPGADGMYTIDWTSTFTATGKDAVLDRTPIAGQPGGKSWGGYAGLSLRMAKETRGWQMVDSQGSKGADINRKKGVVWMGTSGKTPGGKDAGVAVFDYPSNMRHPSPWYTIPKMPYFSPAMLYYEPYTLVKGKSFTLKYKIIVHKGFTDKKFLDETWNNIKGK